MLPRHRIASALLGFASSPASAQLHAPLMLTLDGARNIVVAAEAEAKKNDWPKSIATVDGTLAQDAHIASSGIFALRTTMERDR